MSSIEPAALMTHMAIAAANPTPSPDAPLRLQTLYEHWLRRDAWLLFSEAVPLLLGQDPNEWQFQLKQARLAALEPQVRAALADAVNKTNRPTVLNRESAVDDWEVQPTDIYQWATAQGLAVPEPFERLAQFIMQTVKRGPALGGGPVGGDPVSAAQANGRERVLGAALNLVGKCPENCRDEFGFLSGDKIVHLILEQSIRWFDQERPPLAAAEMVTLIDKWLE
jgi:hypothetical protein